MKRTNTLEGTKCTACDADAFARFKGTPYCKKHYMMITLNVSPMTKRVMRRLESRLI